MIRTRDFILFLLVVIFLLLAITVTVWQSGVGSDAPVYPELSVDGTTATYTAEVVAVADTRAERLAALREKLRDFGGVIAAPEPQTEVEPDLGMESDTATTTDEEIVLAVIDRCATEQTKTIPGLTGMQSYVERDGKRVFYESTPAAPGATSTAVASLQTETVIFTLPLRTTPLAFTSCIGTDVVAVSPTGIQIRNSDYAKYQGSGEATLIGYTLDGFPLYGRTSSLTTDACGGAMVGGTYRYYLSAERAGVLGCFAGIPVAW